jgi:hypothetical protein
MSQPFGAYLQVYKNQFATYKCLESFRRFYPNSTIVLLSDNGYDYSEMAKFFNCIYIHEYENILLTHKNVDDGSHIINSNKIIERIKSAYQLIKEDYVMWLEDDVSINNKISDTFKYDLNGFSPNRIPIIELQKKYTFLDNNFIYRFNGHGGSIFHKNNFLKYLENKEIIEDILINWKTYKFPSDLGQDLFFSVIITLNRGNIGTYDGHYDGYIFAPFRDAQSMQHPYFASLYYCDLSGGVLNDEIYKDNNIIVQHQYKYWYGHPMPKDLKYLVKTD